MNGGGNVQVVMSSAPALTGEGMAESEMHVLRSVVWGKSLSKPIPSSMRWEKSSAYAFAARSI